MKLETKSRLYDVLYAVGQQIMDHHNPCEWKNGKCRRMRQVKDDRGCCEGCKHLAGMDAQWKGDVGTVEEGRWCKVK